VQHSHRHPQIKLTSGGADGVNEVLFQWQKANFLAEPSERHEVYTELHSSPEWRLLMDTVMRLSNQFLENAGSRERVTPESKINAWAAINCNGVFHGGHTHPGSLISGVYYVRIPEGSGSISFMDPRGPRVPFEGKYVHQPYEGDLIVFPSWLYHEVAPTLGTHPRISFSFNVLGEWEETTNVNFSYEANLRKQQQQ
jgi:hypothetical protein